MKQPRSGPSETRRKLLEAAVRLFSEHGFRAVSVRQIAAAAGVNSALVNYHYGSKDSLIEEVIRASAAGHVAERMHHLSQAKRRGVAFDLTGLLRIYLEPLLMQESWAEQGGTLVRLHGYLVTERPDLAEDIVARAFNTVNVAFIDELGALLPHLTREVIIWRFYAMIGSLLFFQIRPAPPGLLSISAGRCDSSNSVEVLAQLLPASIAAFQAPMPQAGGEDQARAI
ncbi:TetR/AcrR family transcriptional regulator [Paracoccus aurantiacus]|uniref:TetR/AcrR family transcriptional regulator n=1 Tax=Paracoccus aurantiacus TaxID=2599412 RepID=A0A5C6RZ68_9RHOB|nr:TetR/AcrR family transcriptional regulator [Paracoccus aurantiacus]TXB67453.1 TetR/AcrR family transcriptional regulator [Paracoccus aurantiacus]